MDEIQASGRDDCALKAVGYLQSLEKFSTFFGLHLAYLIFSATEQLSLTLQSKNTTIQEVVMSSELAVAFLEKQRSQSAFELFYDRVLKESGDLTSEPALPRYRRKPQRYDDGSEAYRFEDAKSFHKQQYYEALETIKGEINSRFKQERGMPIAAALEKSLLDAFKGNFELPDVIFSYSKDLNISRLKVQIQMVIKSVTSLLKTFNLENSTQVIKSVTSLRTGCDLMNYDWKFQDNV